MRHGALRWASLVLALSLAVPVVGSQEREPVKIGIINPLQTIYLLRTERKAGMLQNTPFASYPTVSQFWTWTPDAFMAMPSYVEMKGKWAK